MKKIILTVFIFVLVLLFSSRIYADGQSHQGELIITVINAPSGIVFEFHAVSTRWDENLNLTTNHSYYQDAVTGPGFVDRYDLITAIDDDSNPVVMPLGLIKVLASESNPERYFYLDWRTSTLVTESHGSPDFYVTFNNQTGSFLKDGTTNINGTTQKVWEFSSYPLVTTGFEPYIPNDFDVSTSGSNPYITWNHSSETDYITGYAIYRSLVNQTQQPGTFYKITTVSSSSTSFTDYDLAVGGNMRAYYKITAVNGGRESEFTDTESIIASPYKQSANDINYTYHLSSNYPNPFNPSTKIRFSTPDGENIKIIVYDILGKEIITLINEYKEPGEYEIEFNAKDLPSGTYFYKLQAGKYTDTKKFILLK